MESDEDEIIDADNLSSSDDDFTTVEDITNSKDRSSEYPFEVLNAEQIVQLMLDNIKEVNTIVGIPLKCIRILLNHFKWDKDKLIEKYYDGDQDTFFQTAHIINPFKEPTKETKPEVKKSRTEECEICLATFPPQIMTGLDCGHRFCTNCWCDYLTTKIMDEGLGQSIECAAHKCDILVDDDTVMKLVSDARVKQKYQHLITNSFVECNRLLRWCPSADCAYAIKVLYVDARPGKCKCGHVFCFECGENLHEPVQCHLLKKWIKKCNDDSETWNWIAANTKSCPKCNVPIEKNGGCNHMFCKNENCKHQFCWFCLGSCHDGGFCNRYTKTKNSVSRLSLDRYLHYFKRYINHMESLKFEHQLYASIKTKMEEMQQFNMPWIEVQFLNKAVDMLCQSRQTLMCTYVFAFYLRKNNQMMIFEDNQNDLEKATEKLSEYLERDITTENLTDIKQKVLDKYKYCEMRRNVLLDHVHEGYEKDCWEYLE